MMKKMNALDWVAMVLVIVGGLNWGLYGAFEYDLVASVFGDLTTVSKVVYILVGLSALYMIFGASKMGGGKSMMMEDKGGMGKPGGSMGNTMGGMQQ